MAKKLFKNSPAIPKKKTSAIRKKGGSKKTLAQFRQQSSEEKKQSKRVSHLLGLVDATGLMTPVWDQTKKIIEEVVRDISKHGQIHMHWVAYRDYDTPNYLIENSGWQSEVQPILSFLNKIRCIGGADIPEAVEKGLEFATQDDQCTTIVLIGDAPPHEERDYRQQATTLGRQGKPVYSFVVGNAPDTIRTFGEIAQITGGVSCILENAQDILDLLALTVVANDFGPKELEKFLKNLKATGKALPPGAQKIIDKHLPKSSL